MKKIENLDKNSGSPGRGKREIIKKEIKFSTILEDLLNPQDSQSFKRLVDFKKDAKGAPIFIFEDKTEVKINELLRDWKNWLLKGEYIVNDLTPDQMKKIIADHIEQKKEREQSQAEGKIAIPKDDEIRIEKIDSSINKEPDLGSSKKDETVEPREQGFSSETPLKIEDNDIKQNTNSDLLWWSLEKEKNFESARKDSVDKDRKASTDRKSINRFLLLYKNEKDEDILADSNGLEYKIQPSDNPDFIMVEDPKDSEHKIKSIFNSYILREGDRFKETSGKYPGKEFKIKGFTNKGSLKLIGEDGKPIFAQMKDFFKDFTRIASKPKEPIKPTELSIPKSEVPPTGSNVAPSAVTPEQIIPKEIPNEKITQEDFEQAFPSGKAKTHAEYEFPQESFKKEMRPESEERDLALREFFKKYSKDAAAITETRKKEEEYEAIRQRLKEKDAESQRKVEKASRAFHRDWEISKLPSQRIEDAWQNKWEAASEAYLAKGEPQSLKKIRRWKDEQIAAIKKNAKQYGKNSYRTIGMILFGFTALAVFAGGWTIWKAWKGLKSIFSTNNWSQLIKGI